MPCHYDPCVLSESEIPASILAQKCDRVLLELDLALVLEELAPAEHKVVIFSCIRHGREKRHSVYPQNTADWQLFDPNRYPTVIKLPCYHRVHDWYFTLGLKGKVEQRETEFKAPKEAAVILGKARKTVDRMIDERNLVCITPTSNRRVVHIPASQALLLHGLLWLWEDLKCPKCPKAPHDSANHRRVT